MERLAFCYDRREEITRYSYSVGGRFVLSSNGNARVLLTFKNFRLVL